MAANALQSIATHYDTSCFDVSVHMETQQASRAPQSVVPKISLLQTKIAICGPPCAGKTELAAVLANRFSLYHLSISDEVKNIAERMFEMKTDDDALLRSVDGALRSVDCDCLVRFASRTFTECDFTAMQCDFASLPVSRLSIGFEDLRGVIIDDVRLDSDAQYLIEHDFIVIRLQTDSALRAERLATKYDDRFNDYLQQHEAELTAVYLIQDDHVTTTFAVTEQTQANLFDSVSAYVSDYHCFCQTQATAQRWFQQFFRERLSLELFDLLGKLEFAMQLANITRGFEGDVGVLRRSASLHHNRLWRKFGEFAEQLQKTAYDSLMNIELHGFSSPRLSAGYLALRDDCASLCDECQKFIDAMPTTMVEMVNRVFQNPIDIQQTCANHQVATFVFKIKRTIARARTFLETANFKTFTAEFPSVTDAQADLHGVEANALRVEANTVGTLAQLRADSDYLIASVR